MKKSAIQIISLLVLLAACRMPAKLTAGELVVGTSTGYPPYYYAEDGELRGICVAVVNQAARSLGMRVIYEQYPWKRMLHYGRSGRVDAVMPLFKTDAREQFLFFPDSEIVREENRFFTRAGSGITFSGQLQDLAGHPIGIVTDYSYGKMFDNADYLEKILAKNDLNLVQMFKFKRFDVGLGSRQVVRYFSARIGGIQDLVFLDPPITNAPLYIAFSRAKGHGKLAITFSNALSAFKKSAAYRDILKTYGVLP